jgi:hypothetical protein
MPIQKKSAFDQSAGVSAVRAKVSLNKNVTQTMNSHLDEVAFFYSTLNDEQKKRVKVFLYGGTPKFTIYGCGDKAIIGMFLPKLNAIHDTQFVINGRDGHFAHNVWEYYDSLRKKDITETLLSRLGN